MRLKKIPARRVFSQALTNFPIIIVHSLTLVFNIFVLPYLALIVPFLLQRFSLRELLSGSFTAVEGLSALASGVALSLNNGVKTISVRIRAFRIVIPTLALINAGINAGDFFW